MRESRPALRKLTGIRSLVTSLVRGSEASYKQQLAGGTMGELIRPIDTGAMVELGRRFLGNVQPYDITVVGSFVCLGCHRPHIIRVASSKAFPESVVGVLSLAIIDTIDTYSIVADDEHTSWKDHHHE
jgi:hypothetical protein